jgi:monofunctional glycosyltransferase
VLVVLAFAALTTGCTKIMGLPDVTVLQTQYPVVHYVKLPKAAPTKALAKSKLASPEPSGPEGMQVVTWERQKPSSWVSYGEVSKVGMGAIIVSEDWAFYQHHGYDPNQIKEAINRDLEKKKFARGASTITQQVAKNVFLNSEKSMGRKFKELLLAVKLEEKFKKPKILEVYLNIAEFGEDLYGIGPAAHFYFSKSPSELTAKEGAFLAMLLPSPKRYSQSFRAKQLTAYAAKTITDILAKMVQAQYLTEEEESAEVNRPLSFENISQNADQTLMSPGGPSPRPRPVEDPEEPGERDE